MTTFLEDKQGGLESVSKIAKLPEHNTDIFNIPCCDCRTLVQVDMSINSNTNIVCEKCNAVRVKRAEQKQREDVINRLGGLKAYNRFTLARFTNKTAMELSAVFPAVNLFLWGAAGTGKTHLATAIIREHDGIVIKPQKIYRDCRGIKDGAAEQAAIDRYVNIPFMVIDDLGIYETNFAYSVLVEIIDGRDMGDKKGLIITSNLSLDSLAEKMKDDRVTSRIAGLCKSVEIKDRDHRLDLRTTIK